MDQLSVYKVSSQKLYAIQDVLTWKYECMNDSESIGGLNMDHVFHRGNVERVASSNKYTYSQVSVSYLWSSCNLYEDKLNASVLNLKNRRNDALMSSSLDLDSCLRFLVELYTTWMSPHTNTPVQLLTETVKSVLAISELFAERAQYQWMLDTCLEISRIHPVDNVILHQYLVVCACKAAAVLTPLVRFAMFLYRVLPNCTPSALWADSMILVQWKLMQDAVKLILTSFSRSTIFFSSHCNSTRREVKQSRRNRGS